MWTVFLLSPPLPSTLPPPPLHHQSAINNAQCDGHHGVDESHQLTKKEALLHDQSHDQSHNQSHDLVYHNSEALFEDHPPLPSGPRRKTWGGRKGVGQYELVEVGLSETVK